MLPDLVYPNSHPVPAGMGSNAPVTPKRISRYRELMDLLHTALKKTSVDYLNSVIYYNR